MASKSVDNKHMNLCYPIFSDGSEKAPQAEARGRRIKVLFEKEKYTTTMCIGNNTAGSYFFISKIGFVLYMTLTLYCIYFTNHAQIFHSQ